MRFLMSLKNDARGNVLMLTGLSILFLFAVGGAGVDFGRQQLVRMKLQNASDAAAVAAASLPDSTSDTQRRAVALRYYNLNFPSSYLGVARPTPNIQVAGQIIVDASAGFDANFVSNVGVPRLEAQGRTAVDRVATQASIYDVILVMDTSGSMSNLTTAPNFAPLGRNEIANARNLARLKCRDQVRDRLSWFCEKRNGYLDKVQMGDGSTKSYSSSTICNANAPTDYCNLVSDDAMRKVGDGSFNGFALTGNTRLNALRFIARDFVTRILDEGDPANRMGIVLWADKVVGQRELTNNKSLLNTEITNMAANNGTNPYLAIVQAVTLGRNFAANHIKAVVLLSDGKPTQRGDIDYTKTQKTPQGEKYVDSSGCDGENFCAPAANQTLPLCTQLKNSGVQVYTVGFLNPTDGEFVNEPGSYDRAVSFLRSCASVDGDGAPRYYTAQDGEQLNQAFDQILSSLGRIRISQ